MHARGRCPRSASAIDSPTSRRRFSTATPSATRAIRTSTTCSDRRGCSSARISSRSGCCRSASPPILLATRDSGPGRIACATQIVEPSRCAHRRIRRRRVESPGLERRRASRRRVGSSATPGRRSTRCSAEVVVARQIAHGLLARRNLVRRRELPSVRASRTLVRRDDGGAGGTRARAGAPADDSSAGSPRRSLTALPDFTLPSRRDSQYAISLRQWRIAEHCELGLARERRSDAARRARAACIATTFRADATPRSHPSADVERNCTGVRADARRSELARAAVRAADASAARRRRARVRRCSKGRGSPCFVANEGRAYVALDYGHSGGGHGHPDRLNLLLVRRRRAMARRFRHRLVRRPSLHWYRSTLAHNAPLVDGVSQRRDERHARRLRRARRLRLGVRRGGDRARSPRETFDRRAVDLSRRQARVGRKRSDTSASPRRSNRTAARSRRV